MRFLLIALLILLSTRTAFADISAEEVRRSIEQGVKYLKSQQNKDKNKGNWPEHPAQPGAVTSLVLLALLNSGVEPGDPAVQRALEFLRRLGNPEMTYATSLQTMAFCAAEPEKDRLLIARNVKWLETVQISSDERSGGWGYSAQLGKGDNSNTQFAMLALHEAERIGVEVSEQTWRKSLGYFLRQQKKDGSWGYFFEQPPTGSMTCAALASVVIAQGRLHGGDAAVVDGRVECCREHQENDAVSRGLQWLGNHFTVQQNPSPVEGARNVWLYYYLYGVERVGRMTGQRYFHGMKREDRKLVTHSHDWYREGAEFLVSRQDQFNGKWVGQGHAEDQPVIATSLALLFLSKGRRPVVVAKFQHRDDGDWDSHRNGIPNLTRRIEQVWRRDLTWQTIDARLIGGVDDVSRKRAVSDLLETPVLFISGRQEIFLTDVQKENLKQYLNNGGFIFAEACCQGEEFDRSFRALVKELFPDSSLRLLPPDHPVWFAEQKVDSRYLRPLYGVDACCRTSLVYCPQTLSCYWELAYDRRMNDYPAAVRDEIEAVVRIGENVIAYATNRQLKDKLDRPNIADSSKVDKIDRGTLIVPKLMHGGGSDDAPNSLPNLLKLARQQLGLRLSPEHRMVAATDGRLYEYPVVFLHGRRDFEFTGPQREALRTYLKNGGFLFADSICASPQFTAALRRELQTILPGRKLERIPASHELFSTAFRGFDVKTVTLRDPETRADTDQRLSAKLTKTTPLLEGIELDGRFVVVFSPYDLSCALENHASLECKGYIPEDAARIGMNVLLFALQQ